MAEDGESVTLRKFNGEITPPAYFTEQWRTENLDSIRSGLVVDVETTGLNKSEDQIIEIGLRHFLFNRTNGDILLAEESYQGFQDPGVPLSEEIKALTGLDDSLLRGQSIDWAEVERHFSAAQIILAHNASFDRPFLDRALPISGSRIWGCSLKQIDWGCKGFTSQKLDVLCIYHGFFTAAHRALNDASALLQLLSFKDEQTQKTYLHELLANAKRSLVRIVAQYSPFEAKGLLKDRGYSWDPNAKSWSRSVFKEDRDAEVSWLEEAVYQGPFRGTAQEIPVMDHFKMEISARTSQPLASTAMSASRG